MDHDLHGSFEITQVLSGMAVGLNLRVKWKIYTVFHVSLVAPFIQGHRQVN
jgi:hypothetical protein